MNTFMLKLVLIGTAIAIIGVGLTIIHGSIWDSGYDSCKADVAESTRLAEEETRAKQSAIRKKTKEDEHEVRKEQGADAPASPYLRGVLERLRSND